MNLICEVNWKAPQNASRTVNKIEAITLDRDEDIPKEFY